MAASLHVTLATISSALFRLAAFLFLRLVSGHHWPPLILAFFAVYCISLVPSLRAPARYVVLGDRIDVAVKETTVTEDDGSEPVGEIDVVESIAVRDKGPSPLATVLLGAPNPRSLALSLASLLVNLVLVGFTLDHVYHARLVYPSHDLSFVRLGYVSPTEASFLLREPDQARMPVTLELRAADPHAPAAAAAHAAHPAWLRAGDVRSTGNETDFTAALAVPLRHGDRCLYRWRTSNGHSGEFRAPPGPGRGRLTFLATSCILPRFPYHPLHHPLGIPGLRHLARLLPGLGAQFMLFLGDFIYVDVPSRLGASVEDYRMKYRQVYASPDWPAVARNLSWIHVIDDHEIANDWSSNTTGVYSSAIDPYEHYHVRVNPPATPAARARGTPQLRAKYFEFAQGPASFFLLDTRSFRSPNGLPAGAAAKTMLGADQLQDLLAWLARPEPRGVRWKVVGSSVPFTKNWPVNRKDTWGGFLAERRTVLEAMWDAGARGMGVVVLSGDRHEFAATKFPPPPGGRWPESAAPHEFSASPLNQFASPVPTYKQTDDEDVMLGYIHNGRSKFGALTMEVPEDGRRGSLRYSLYVDGVEAWNTTVLTPDVPVAEEAGAAASFWSRIGL